MRDSDARASQPSYLGAIEVNAVRDPGAAAHPPEVFHELQRTLLEALETVDFFVFRFGHVRVQANIEFLRQFRGPAHQRRRRGERRAGYSWSPDALHA